jgi:hypothetical protein
MGGPGSGWRSGSSKTPVEDCLVLSTARLMRIGLLRANLHRTASISWSDSYTEEKLSSIGFDPNIWNEHGVARLYYSRSSTGEHMDYRVQLTSTSLPWGGRRWWFTCPLVISEKTCGRRVGKLYLPPGAEYFGCRQCYDLTYQSCQESHKHDGWAASLGSEFGLSAREVLRMLSKRFQD